MSNRTIFSYRYWLVLTIVILPSLLVAAFPPYAPIIRTIASITILPAVCVTFILTFRPVVDQLRGTPSFPFSTNPTRAVFYLTLRILLFIGGLYGFVIFVFPAWQGAYELYLRGQRPDVLNIIVQDQGLGLSIPALGAPINTPNDNQTFIWLYGRTLRLSDTQSYTLTLLPHSNIVIDVTPTPQSSASSTAPSNSH
jgi:hypothetical protein